MSAPPHSVPHASNAHESYDERNNFLFFVLGVIAVTERTLSLLVELGDPPQTDSTEDAAHRAKPPGSVLR
jgi:hypothetical protein